LLRVVSHEKATKWCNSLGFPYFETSAKEGVNHILLTFKTNVAQAFQILAKKSLGQENEKNEEPSTINFEDIKKDKPMCSYCGN
jgi:tRNA A37 threonylcarbamoyladenosine synthetase subunit TsaC/SUA5/YrdC